MVMFPQLNEDQRLQYLQAMGVTSWLPKQPLLGSLRNDLLWQSQQYTAVPVAATQGDQQQQPPQQSELESPAAAVAQALGSLGTKEEAEPASSELPVASSVTADVVPTNVAPMHIGLSWYASGVLVLNDVPVQDGAAMSSPIQRLQVAIVNALGGSGLQTMPLATSEFHWPLVPGPHGDHSLAGAQSGLNYSLVKLLQDKVCHQILVMGPAPAQLLEPELALGGTSKIQFGSQPALMVYSHSLHQLLAVPSLKAATWAHLQPLLVSE